MLKHAGVLVLCWLAGGASIAQSQEGEPNPMASSAAPRIVHIINFIRGVEPRTEVDLLLPVVKQLELVKQHGLPATFLIQYDAMEQERFSSLLKAQLPPNGELGGWFEVVQPMVEAAGLKWRGRYPWDWHVNVGFPVGYAPAEREKLVDVFMEKFKATFGYLPKSVGSWLLDAHTLGYMADRYGVIASCNCKDQIGTDGYTLWGGYWNQAYYPSRKNAYMPAQHAKEQIPVPVFRMLGSDPIYQYDAGFGEAAQSVVTLEPAYKEGGGNPAWVRWFFRTLTDAPCLTFGYAQVGQENSFGWPVMGEGLTDQMGLLEELSKQGKVRVETLAASGEWFRKTFATTPETCVTALEDWKNEGRASVWYNSRYYRANVFWDKDGLCIRDIHLFDERYPERYLTEVETSSSCVYDTLPVVDGFCWSTREHRAGLTPVAITEGKTIQLSGRAPVVEEVWGNKLRVRWPLLDIGELEAVFQKDTILFTITKVPGELHWGLQLAWSPEKRVPVIETRPQEIVYTYNGFVYSLAVPLGAVIRVPGASEITIHPQDGKIRLLLRNPH